MGKDLKKEEKRTRARIRKAFFYSVAGALILMGIFLVILFKFSPLGREYLYFISALCSFVIAYPLGWKFVKGEVGKIYSSANELVTFLESLSEGNMDYQPHEGEKLSQLWENAMILSQSYKDRVLAVYNSLLKVKEGLDSSQWDKVKEEISSLLSNFKEEFHLTQ